MISKFLTVASVLTLSATSVFAQETTNTGTGADFGTFDTDQSGDISQEEFGTGSFQGADQNTDAMLDETEYGTTGMSMTFSELDADGDGMISQEEWLQATGSATGEGSFGSFDTDVSGGLDETEFETYSSQAGGATGTGGTDGATGTTGATGGSGAADTGGAATGSGGASTDTGGAATGSGGASTDTGGAATGNDNN